jgi:uncharacterized protein
MYECAPDMVLNKSLGCRIKKYKMQRDVIVSILCEAVPKLLAIYAFGSRIQGIARPESDLDIAVLLEGYAAPLLLWTLSSKLAEKIGCEVDLLDFRAASTVMQYQILSTGECWWSTGLQVDLFEVAVYSEKTALDEARKALLEDIRITKQQPLSDVFDALKKNIFQILRHF